ncbi:hypothetical protein AMTRI_Chr09g37520 [Amborella trichopoda]|uniref:WAT1-related protein n=1 Tax=Amborella trichopoda TaxID=13333 RepID=W1PM04_AMBTC|nr:WAT1-related protein At2g39510 [Amborella trichopoda]ERN08160.1 hypothetical protein AMTR_s00018p00139030 [Amborella trichopoda]|eukprot:XP_011624201.2 WAT1-related protein At2g39510 [Amborella trichopoda]
MAGWAPYAMMIFLQLAYGTADIVSKGAMERGMSYHVFIMYRHVVSTLVLSPFAFYLERKTRPSLTRPIFFKLFLLALCGFTATQNAYFAGLMYSSPTVVGAMNNICPAITFILAMIFRMESVKIKSPRGQAKLLGTSICIGGAMLFAFYKGHLFPPLKIPFINIHSYNSAGGTEHAKPDWVKGSSIAIVATSCWSVFLILQNSVYKLYPAPLSMNAWISFLAVMQSAAVAVIFDRTASPWKIGWNLELLSYVYYGILVSAVGYSLQAWCIAKRGPVFVALFFPLQLIIAAILTALFFKERLHLGSVVGAILIIVGFYCVMWGKSKDDKNDEKVEEKNEMIADVEKASKV